MRGAVALGHLVEGLHVRRLGVARPSGMTVLTLAGDAVGAITWFSDTGVIPSFGLPRTVPVSRLFSRRSPSG